MEITHIQKYIPTSPRKLRLVADAVRKNTPAQALQMLKFINKAAADPMAKAIQTAIANSTQRGLLLENLNFKSLEVNEGLKLKRVMSGGRGRRRIYVKKSAHIRVVLTDEASGKDQASRVKNKKLKTEKEKNGTEN